MEDAFRLGEHRHMAAVELCRGCFHALGKEALQTLLAQRFTSTQISQCRRGSHYKKGFVNRVECSTDRPVRTVSLTEKGRQMFVPLFRRHTALIKRAFQDISFEEMQHLERVLKRIGKRAESLAESKVALQLDERG